MPRAAESVAEKDARRSLMAPLRNRFGTVRFEKANVKGCPSGLGSTSAHSKREVVDMMEGVVLKIRGFSFNDNGADAYPFIITWCWRLLCTVEIDSLTDNQLD